MLTVPRTMLHPSANSAEEGLKGESFAGAGKMGTPLAARIDRQIDFD